MSFRDAAIIVFLAVATPVFVTKACAQGPTPSQSKKGEMARFLEFKTAKCDRRDVVAAVLSYTAGAGDSPCDDDDEDEPFWYAKSKCVYVKAGAGFGKFNSEAQV